MLQTHFTTLHLTPICLPHPCTHLQQPTNPHSQAHKCASHRSISRVVSQIHNSKCQPSYLDRSSCFFLGTITSPTLYLIRGILESPQFPGWRNDWVLSPVFKFYSGGFKDESVGDAPKSEMVIIVYFSLSWGVAEKWSGSGAKPVLGLRGGGIPRDVTLLQGKKD